MRLMMVNLPFAGHVYPTLGLANELVKQGHSVIYVLGEEWRGEVQATGCEFMEYSHDGSFGSMVRTAYQMARLIGPECDAVLFEQLFFMGSKLASELQKPAVRLITTQAVNQPLMDAFLQGGGPMGVFRHKWVRRHWTGQLGLETEYGDWTQEIVQAKVGLNLVFTTREFQMHSEEFAGEQYVFLGPSIYKRPTNVMVPFDSFYQPVVYIAMGSVLENTKRLYKKCFKALADLPVTVIAAVGKGVDISALGRLPDNVLPYPFVPQLEVLRNASLFITHGGMNSVNEAMYYGVPMIVVPFSADGPSNAKQVERLGVGVRLRRETLTKTALRSAVLEMLFDPATHANCRALAQRTAAAPGNKTGAEIVGLHVERCKQEAAL